MYNMSTYIWWLWLQMTLEEAIGYVASDELIEVSSSIWFIILNKSFPDILWRKDLWVLHPPVPLLDPMPNTQ